MNILFILDYYLPKASANGVCVEKLVNQFAKSGDQVSVLAFHQADECMEQEKNRIYYCCNEQQDKMPVSWAMPFIYYIKWLLPSKKPVYERKAVTDEIIRKADEIINANHIDTVICVHLPIESLLAGIELKKKHPEVCFVAYALDSLSGGFLPRYLPEGFCRRRKIRWENQIYSHFDKIVLMQSGKEHHQKISASEEWYLRSVYLDIPLFMPDIAANCMSSGEMSITFVGTMADHIREPYHFLNVLNKVNYRFTLIIAGNNSCGDLNQYCQSSHIKIQQLGHVPHADAVKLIKSSSILLNLGNRNTSQVPSKIFEYMSVGKPIISTYCEDTDSCLPYLRQYPNVLLIDERNQDFDVQAEEFERFAITCGANNVDAQKLSECFEKNTPDAFIRAIKE